MIKSDLYSSLNISRIDTRFTNTYSLADYKGFFFDIVTIIDNDAINYEAYLYHGDYGIKDLMFGVSGKDSSYEEFLILVVGNIDDYVDGYMQEYMD